MTIIALVIGVILGAIATYFWTMHTTNKAIEDVIKVRQDYAALRAEVDGFEAREDEICQACIDDTVKQFQLNAERMSGLDGFILPSPVLAVQTPPEEEPIG